MFKTVDPLRLEQCNSFNSFIVAHSIPQISQNVHLFLKLFNAFLSAQLQTLEESIQNELLTIKSEKIIN